MLDVIVPAGGTIPAEYAARIGTPLRALAPLGSARVPVLQHVINTLHDSGCARHIIAVAPPAVSEQITGVDEWLPSGDSGPENIRAGLARLPEQEALALVCTSDLPLLTAAAVQEFVSRCRSEFDVTLGVVGQSAYQAAFPNAPMSTFVPFRDIGPVTMACLFQVRPSLLTRNTALLEAAFGARKSQWQMARLLGSRLLTQFALRRLTLRAVQPRAEALLECRTEVLQNCSPALALDIDTADDYAYADQRFSETAAANASAPHTSAADHRPVV